MLMFQYIKLLKMFSTLSRLIERKFFKKTSEENQCILDY